MSNTDPTQKTGVKPGLREGQAVPTSYKTPHVTHFIYNVYSKYVDTTISNKQI